jgi:hypothetical protein
MMARSTCSKRKPNTLTQDRISQRPPKASCTARPDHTLGHLQTFPAQDGMSASPLKADIATTTRNVGYGDLRAESHDNEDGIGLDAGLLQVQ